MLFYKGFREKLILFIIGISIGIGLDSLIDFTKIEKVYIMLSLFAVVIFLEATDFVKSFNKKE